MKFDLRIENSIKEFLLSFSERSSWSVSRVVNEMAWVGLDVYNHGGFTISGPLGLERPFAVADFGAKDERLTVWIDEDLYESLSEVFQDDIREGLRLVIKNCILAIYPSQIVIRNVFLRVELPLTKLGPVILYDERAKESLKKILEINLD